jgi:hypothetical protein
MNRYIFSLRTLMVVMLLGGPALALMWSLSNQIPGLEALFILLLSLVGFCVFGASFVLAAALFAWIVGAIAAAMQRAVDAFSKSKD